MKTKKAAAYAKLMEQAAAYVREAKPSCKDPGAVAAILAPLLAAESQEMFFCVHLTIKNMMIGAPNLITKGLLNSAPVGMRETFRGAIVDNAAAIIIAHNHPSGDPTPSTEDIQITNRIVKVGKIIGIDVLDHLIIGQPSTTSPGWLSIRERGLVDFT